MIRINLLPERRARRRLVAGVDVIVVFLLVVAGLAVAYSYGKYQNNQVRKQVDAINRELVELRPKAAAVLNMEQQLEALRAKEDLLKTLEARQLPWPELLADLAERTPKDAWLASAAVSLAEAQTRRLALQGSALSYDAVARFMTNLSGSQYYSVVDLQAAQLSPIGARDVVQFSLTVTLRQTIPVSALGAPR